MRGKWRIDRIIDFAIEAKYMPGLRNGITINDWR
ncbi:hypothetical protein WRSd5_00721 [Shigella dysenteriae WRSd5]|uniref:Uncharacterized protein n=1 Tax=Shigella dysenteriae 1617 TaxID=754093 RepID=A0A0A6ZYF3_SHIDY|nr:hypothetical protein Asd1617_04113 [Shigella dysenteriae 1617]ESU84497.1 hypothetical protein WRSd5_00721 [Shigella dysenteriae WRSd5]